MSFYSSWSGELKFKDKQTRQKAIEILAWHFDEGYLENCSDDNSLSFPECITGNDGNRNVHRVIEEITKLPHTGVIIGTSIDGCEEGYVINNGEELPSEDLKSYGKTIGLDLDSVEEDSDDYNIMLGEIEEKWIDQKEEEYGI